MFLFENLSVFLAVYTILSSGSASFHVKAQEWFQTSGKPVKNVAIIGMQLIKFDDLIRWPSFGLK